MLLQNRQNYQNINQPVIGNEVDPQDSMRQVELKQDVVIMDYDSLNSGRNDHLIHVELGMSNEAMIGTEENSEDLEFAQISPYLTGSPHLVESTGAYQHLPSPNQKSFDILSGTQTNTVQSIEP